MTRLEAVEMIHAIQKVIQDPTESSETKKQRILDECNNAARVDLKALAQMFADL